MSGQLPERPELRLSDADREKAVQRLHDAVAEGRLTLPEFEERVDQVLQARTSSELAPPLADLPAVAGGGPAPEHGELRTKASSITRTGPWVVPRRLTVRSKAGSVRLDLTEAVIHYPVIEVTLDVVAGSTKLIMPPGASADVDEVEMVASTTKVRKVPVSTQPLGKPHVVVTGSQRAGSLVVRYQRRFLWWRW